MEDVVSEGLAGPAPGRSVASAWVALDAGSCTQGMYTPPGLAAAAAGAESTDEWHAAGQQHGGGATGWEAWAAAAAAMQAGPMCYGCGQRGHIRRVCPSAAGREHGRAQGKDKLDAILDTLAELTTELRATRTAQTSTRAPGRGATADGKSKK